MLSDTVYKLGTVLRGPKIYFDRKCFRNILIELFYGCVHANYIKPVFADPSCGFQLLVISVI